MTCAPLYPASYSRRESYASNSNNQEKRRWCRSRLLRHLSRWPQVRFLPGVIIPLAQWQSAERVRGRLFPGHELSLALEERRTARPVTLAPHPSAGGAGHGFIHGELPHPAEQQVRILPPTMRSHVYGEKSPWTRIPRQRPLGKNARRAPGYFQVEAPPELTQRLQYLCLPALVC